MLSEWHLSPDYIINNWTDELLNLMIEKLAERKTPSTEPQTSKSSTNASDEELLAKMGIKVKHGD